MLRRTLYTLLLVLVAAAAFAQDLSLRYEYWTDSDFDNRVSGSCNEQEVTFATSLRGLTRIAQPELPCQGGRCCLGFHTPLPVHGGTRQDLGQHRLRKLDRRRLQPPHHRHCFGFHHYGVHRHEKPVPRFALLQRTRAGSRWCLEFRVPLSVHGDDKRTCGHYPI